MNSDRRWMYKRLTDGYLNPEFVNGVENFLKFAKVHSAHKDGEMLKCPCNLRKCSNKKFLSVDIIHDHLFKNGFEPNYYTWIYHGERRAQPTATHHHSVYTDEIPANIEPTQHSSASFINMVHDAAGPTFDFDGADTEELPNLDARMFYDMLKAGKRPLYPGCEEHTQLSFVSRLMNLKAENNFSQKCYNQLLELIKEILPQGNLVPDNFYESKKLLKGIGLPVEKIDCCKNNCMIYWEDDQDMIACKVCGEPRFKPVVEGNSKRRNASVAYKKMHYFPLTPRLQRLYASESTAKHMRWHAEHVIEDDVMNHPSDSEAWKHFDQIHPEFASETRNVRLGLCTDGFQPYGCFGATYSSWPVIVTPFNLPHWMCMKTQFMFLSVLVPGPQNPKDKLDVFLQPLIKELNMLWEDGVTTYDISRKQNFQLRVALMWTISDFPAYSMLSGWSTAGRKACPYCMERSDAFTLRCSRKQSWFDNHRKFLDCDHKFRKDSRNFRKGRTVNIPTPNIRQGTEMLEEIESLGLLKVTEPNAAFVNAQISKTSGWKKRSIFWDLPYWKTNLIRHNLDVMHIEKNVFENVFNTVMMTDKTKDTLKSREELNDYCNRPKLAPDELGNIPKACYALEKPSRTALCDWVKSLRFPDGYSSNLGRCVKGLRLVGMKSHDFHIFMQRLIPIAFRELLPQSVWKVLTELSLFFKELTAVVLRAEDMIRLEHEIPLILCQLELIFPPSFFDSMEHLPVPLPYEAKIAGPVQYRWMYPFERYLRKLKNNVKNKARVEGSIANAFQLEEASTFSSYYFGDTVLTNITMLARNDDVQSDLDDDEKTPSVFIKSGNMFGTNGKRTLEECEYTAARIYILLNCKQVDGYISVYEDSIRHREPNITDDILNQKLVNEFADWFKYYATNPSNKVTDADIVSLANGPSRYVNTYTGCKINGYRFHTFDHGSNKATSSSGVCIKGFNYGSTEYDYYGRLMEIVELEYGWSEKKKNILLFKCDWFDPTPTGTKIHPQYNIVDLNHKRKFNRYEPFVLASQAEQVYYCPYPSLKKDKLDWWAACKIKARSNFEFIEPLPEKSYQEEVVYPRNSIELNDLNLQMDNDHTCSYIDDCANEVGDSSNDEDELLTDQNSDEDNLPTDEDTCEDDDMLIDHDI